MKAIDASFRSVNWNQRRKMLEPKMRAKACDDTFFAKYRGCVFSNRNAPGTDLLRGTINLSLDELRTTDAEGNNIFPARAFFAVRSAHPMGSILRR